jgi:hypothetical protein
MAKTIGQLTQATTLASGDEFIIEQSGLTKRVAASVVRGGLVNADIDAAAAIAHTKLANITAGRVLLGNASNVPTATELTGDVTVSSTGVTAIGSAKVTAPMLTGAQTGSAPIYGCRAWVNFDGTRNAADTGASTNGANVLIRASGNVASVLKNGTGDYTVTFTTAMPNANYAMTACCRPNAGGGTPHYTFVVENKDNATRSTSALRVWVLNTSSVAPQDGDVVSLSIFC